MYGIMHEGHGNARPRTWRGVGAASMLALLPLVACGGGHELARYSFTGKTVAVADYPAPAPDLWTGDYDVGGDDVITAVVDAGSRVAKEVEARHARARLDSAANLVDVRQRLSARTLDRTARYLGATTAEDPSTADYLLEIYVREFGIDARGSSARVFMKVEAVLLDRRTGHEAWSIDVDSHDRLTPSVRSGVVPADIVTAGTLRELTVEDMHLALAGLTDFTSDYVTRELREDLRDARD